MMSKPPVPGCSWLLLRPSAETSRASDFLNVCDKPVLSQPLSLKGTEKISSPAVSEKQVLHR